MEEIIINGKKEHIKKVVSIVLISAILEIILSNYNIISCLRQPHNVVVENTINGIDENGRTFLEIDSIEYEVKNITFVYASKTNDLVRYTVFVDQYGQEMAYIEYPEKWDVASSSTRICTNCMTLVHSIKIAGDFSKDSINKIILNSTIFKFNFLRFAIVVILCLFFMYGKMLFTKEASLKWKPIIISATILNTVVLLFATLNRGGYLRDDRTRRPGYEFVSRSVCGRTDKFLSRAVR